MKENLIKSLSIAVGDCNLTDNEIKIVASYLLAEGWKKPLCSIGDKVYQVFPLFEEKIIEELEVTEITTDKDGILALKCKAVAHKNTCYFLRNHNLHEIKFSKEEAEKELLK